MRLQNNYVQHECANPDRDTQRYIGGGSTGASIRTNATHVGASSPCGPHGVAQVRSISYHLNMRSALLVAGLEPLL